MRALMCCYCFCFWYCCCWQVCVPKNTVLCVTREKGGFLSMLQSSVSLSRVPDPRLQEVRSVVEED
jgi:hypothetical protein